MDNYGMLGLLGMNPEQLRSVFSNLSAEPVVSYNSYPSELETAIASSYVGQNDLAKLLGNIDANIMAKTDESTGKRIFSGGGRLGYNMPINEGLLRLGLYGGGYKGKVQTDKGWEKIGGFNLSGGDIGYSTKNGDISLQYQEIPGIDKLINLIYSRQF